MAPEAAVPNRPFPVGRRGWVLLAILAAGVASYVVLDISVGGLIPSKGGLGIVLKFLSRSVTPALTYESTLVPEDAQPLLVQALNAARRTLVFAAAAMSLSLILGILLGFPAATAWWEGDPSGGRTATSRFFRRIVAPAVYGSTRTVITLMRSVHELLWAVLFLSAFGFNTFAGVIAIAIPYGGTLAKIFSEIIDEAARDSAHALRASGASSLQVFFFGLLPRALPDMMAYAFYRFECSVRSSAVLGFFGYQTLGYYIRSSFNTVAYGQTWTYLWTLFLLVLVLDVWSGAVRRRFVTA